MSRRDLITGRSCMFGNKRSHALNSTRRKFNLNLQTVHILINGKLIKLKVSTKTLRTLRKQKS